MSPWKPIKLITRYTLSTLVVLVVILVSVAYFGTQVLLERYRPQLVAEISDSIGCPVTYTRATMRLTPALEVVLHDVSVMGSSLGFEVTTQKLAAKVKLGALAGRHLDFDEISLSSPSIVIVPGAQQSTPSTQAPPPPAAPSPLSVPVVTTPALGHSSMFDGIDSIAIDAGRISKRSADGRETLLLDALHLESALVAKGNTITVTPSRASFALPLPSKGAAPILFTAALKHLTYTIDTRSLSIEGAQLMTETSSVIVSGSMDLLSNTLNATLQGSKVSLAPLQGMLGMKALAGTSDLDVTVSLSDRTLQAAGTFGVTALGVTPASGESYGAASLSGPITFTRTQGTGVLVTSQNVAVQGFSYQDPNVRLNHVNGNLANITGSIGEDGAASFSVAVHGTGLDLTSGPFTIKKIATVDAPLLIKVPAGPGYSISGPVKASGVDMTFHERPLNASSGDVNMLISDAVLHFDSKSIKTESNGYPLSIGGTVEITDSAYSMNNIVGQIAGGSLAATVSIQRQPKQLVETEVLAQGLDVSALRSLWTGDPKSSFSGKMDHLSVKAVARKSDIVSSATGEGVIEITDGTVRHAKFDRKVVGLIKAIPVVGEAVSFTSSATDSSTYEMNGGMLKELTADFTIGAGRLTSKNIKAQGKFSNLVASGDISFSGSLDITASAVYLEQNLRALAGPIRPLGSILGTIGKIEIPLLIKGSIGDPQISADLSRLQDISSPGRAISPILRGFESVVDSATGN